MVWYQRKEQGEQEQSMATSAVLELTGQLTVAASSWAFFCSCQKCSDDRVTTPSSAFATNSLVDPSSSFDEEGTSKSSKSKQRKHLVRCISMAEVLIIM